MKFQDIQFSVEAQFELTNRVTPFILGKPGGGKSALARLIGQKGINGKMFDRVVEFTASLRDPVDLLGTPDNKGDFTRWVPPEEFYHLQTGRNLLILEELSDAPTPMQNALCCLINDRRINGVKLSDETYIIATGNRTEDKSGANRITSKLANRTRRFDFDENLDDWCEWALDQDMPIELIQFIRFKPNLLSDFDPNRFANPTPRAWEKVALIPAKIEKYDPAVFMENVAGEVGSGAAAEYVAFRRIAAGLPDIDSILMNPAKAEVPVDLAVRYALVGALIHRTSVDNVDRASEYVGRFPVDFTVMYWADLRKIKPECTKTKAFTKFAVANANALV